MNLYNFYAIEIDFVMMGRKDNKEVLNIWL